ncbi:unnamed protein product [Durusdinium trenchii]|uniref:Uncharacterized protein n=2 Tax=Durusdinium trenchii TaxID=1381693 RepID=A0ABP0NW88_9DINO
MVDDSHTSCGVVSCTVDSQFLSIEESYLPSYNHFSVTFRRCLPAPGPAVGPGLDGDRARRGQDLEAEPNRLRMTRERMSRGRLRSYRSKTRNVRIYQAAVRLWGAGLLWSTALQTATDAFDEAEADD